MGNAIVVPETGALIPLQVAAAGETAARRFIEFFTANIRNRNTRQAYALELDRQLGDLARERERNLIVAIVDWRARVAADIKGLVDREQDRGRVRDLLIGHFLAVDGQHSGTTLPEAWAVIFEIEDKRVSAWCERLRPEA